MKIKTDVLLSLSADWWWSYNIKDRLFDFSHGVTESLGYLPAELRTLEDLAKVVHESDAESIVNNPRPIGHSTRVSDMRIRLRTKAGVWRTMFIRARYRYEDGVLQGIYGIARDIDDVLAAEGEVLQRNEDLAQVASILSHDFRGPARHILGCTERIVEQLDILQASASDGRKLNFSEIREWTRLTHYSADRLGRMIEHVLQYSRAGTNGITIEDVDVSDVVADILRDYNDRIVERNVRVRVHSMPIVRYDPTMLYLVLANLISNAIKFSKKDDESPLVEVDGRRTVGDWASISVRDHGIGFQSSQQEKILEMGFRLHHEKDYAGFGYGLAIVKRILHRCGGELGMRSRPDEGSEFVLKLPAGRMVRG